MVYDGGQSLWVSVEVDLLTRSRLVIRHLESYHVR